MFKSIARTVFSKKLKNWRFNNEHIFCKKKFASLQINEKDLKLEKVIIVRKVTRYEYEKYVLKPNLTESDLKRYVRIMNYACHHKCEC